MPGKKTLSKVFSFELFLWGIGVVLASLICSKLWTNKIHQLERYFPRTTISEAGVVGYAQYTGYPLVSDTTFMVIYALLPLGVTFGAWVVRVFLKKVLRQKYPSFNIQPRSQKLPHFFSLKSLSLNLLWKYSQLTFFIFTTCYLFWVWFKLPIAPLVTVVMVFFSWLVSSFIHHKNKASLNWFTSWCYWLPVFTVITVLYRLIESPVWYIAVTILTIFTHLIFSQKLITHVHAEKLAFWKTAPIWISTSIAYFSRYLSDGCFKDIAIGFDSQNFLAWDYAGALQLLPYKDIFYLYGYLLYFRFSLVSAQAIYFLGIALFCASVFIFAKYWIRSWLAWVITAVAIIFTLSSNMYFAIGRYGCATFGALALAIIIQRWGKHHLTWVISGALTSLVFASIHDQGGYLAVALFAMAITYGVRDFWIALFTAKDTTKNAELLLKTIGYTVKYCALIFVGIVLGLLPLIAYLYATGSLEGFIEFLGQLKYMNLYAKTPFMNFVLIPGNHFLLLTQLAVTTTLGWYAFFLPHKIKHSTFLGLVGIGIVLAVFQVKNYLRPTIDQQLIFTAIMAWIVILGSWRWWLIEVFEKRLTQLGMAFAISTVAWNWHVLPRTSLWVQPLTNHFVDDFPNQVNDHVYQSDVAYCLETTFERDNVVLQPSYTQVWKELSQNGSYNPKIFSYPADPVFYFLFNQQPSFIFNIYDGSAESAQLRVIRDLEHQKPEFVIFNSSVLSIQDGVPDIIRANTLWNWITSHYKATKKIEEFIIFEPGNENLLTNPLLSELPGLKDLLYHVPLGQVACLDGSKITPEILTNATITATSLSELNKELAAIEKLDRHWLIIKLPTTPFPASQLFFSQNELETSVKMLECNESEYLVIPVHRLPAFNQTYTQPYQLSSPTLQDNSWWVIEDTNKTVLW